MSEKKQKHIREAWTIQGREILYLGQVVAQIKKNGIGAFTAPNASILAETLIRKGNLNE